MANTKRREKYTDRNNNMFIPMNVEGGVQSDSFFTSNKLLALILIFIGFVVDLAFVSSKGFNGFGKFLFLGGYIVLSTFVIRYIVFEEKFYYKMYKLLKQYEICDPGLFWNIISIKETDEGATINYADGKVGVLISVERDTITGKESSFRETHYDALSDFFRDLAQNSLSFVIMNIMETAGKDERLTTLNKLTTKSDNPNINTLMTLQIGHINNLAKKSLYEKDYYLIYTLDLTREDTLISTINECVLNLLDGAFIGYSIIGIKGISEFVRDRHNVKYFNLTQAQLRMFSNNEIAIESPFKIDAITWKNGETQSLNNQDINKLRTITTRIINEQDSMKSLDLKKAIYRAPEEISVGVDIDELMNEEAKRQRKYLEIQNQQAETKKKKFIGKKEALSKLNKKTSENEVEVPVQQNVASTGTQSNNGNGSSDEGFDDEIIDI